METLRAYINSRIKLINNDRTLHYSKKIAKLSSLTTLLSLTFKCESYRGLQLEAEKLLSKLDSSKILAVNKKAKQIELEKILKLVITPDEYSQKLRFEL